MNFREFLAYKENLLKARPNLIDLSETDIKKGLASIRETILIGPAQGKVHRCHLAEAWLNFFRLPQSWRSRAYVTQGVRHALSLIFPKMTSRREILHIPSDVYPVYEELAVQAGLIAHRFDTIPSFHLTPTPPSRVNGEFLLLPNPLKPLGRHLMPKEVAQLKEWLSVSPLRRLILDAVYAIDSDLHESTLQLFETGQTIVLHSLSKGWATPKIFGIALVPESDAGLWGPVFRENSPQEENLHQAWALLTDLRGIPRRTREILRTKWTKLTLAVASTDVAHFVPKDSVGYLAAIPVPAAALLDQGILSLPISAFGSPRQDWSVISSLAMKESI